MPMLVIVLFLQVSIFCGRLFRDYFANQVASTKILVTMAPKVVAAWRVIKNRTQCVKLRNIRSSHENLMSGVPQGSMFGSNLFNVFVNDLFYSVKKAKLSTYADDKQLYFSPGDVQTLQRTPNSKLAVVSSWISDNSLILNTKKCKSFLFRRSKTQCHQKNEENISLSINATVTKLLGVHIENLNFSKHVTSLCKKTSKQIAIINRFKKLLSTKTKLLSYKAYIPPHYNYCSTVWMHCGKNSSCQT